MALTTERLEFDFCDNRPNYVVDHEVTTEDFQEFSEDMIDRCVDRDYWCDYFGEWLETKHADFYRAQASQIEMELAS